MRGRAALAAADARQRRWIQPRTDANGRERVREDLRPRPGLPSVRVVCVRSRFNMTAPAALSASPSGAPPLIRPAAQGWSSPARGEGPGLPRRGRGGVFDGGLGGGFGLFVGGGAAGQGG